MFCIVLRADERFWRKKGVGSDGGECDIEAVNRGARSVGLHELRF